MNSRENSLRFLHELISTERSQEEGKSSTREKRQTECLKDPERSDNERDEWFIYVPSCFNYCLDIKRTPRVLKTGHRERDEKTGKITERKEARRVWTQGSRFAFHRGCLLYDNHRAYRPWTDAVHEVKYCVSIHGGVPAEPSLRGKKRLPGTVEFSVFSPTGEALRSKEGTVSILTQDDFLAFLIDGNPDIIQK
jgi:hypothetical protein